MKNVWPLQRDAIAFYGNPFASDFASKNIVMVSCPWNFKTGRNKIQAHKKVAPSLLRVLTAVWELDCGKDITHIQHLGYDVFDGSFVIRNKRGGSSLSMHSFGVAFDFDAAQNMQHSLHHLFGHNTPLVDRFLAESWIWGGDWSPGSIDAMHFQAARVHP